MGINASAPALADMASDFTDAISGSLCPEDLQCWDFILPNKQGVVFFKPYIFTVN